MVKDASQLGKRLRIALLAAGCALAGTALGAGAPRSGMPNEPAGYAYVGLDRTIGRIEPVTGRVWVLAHPSSTKASLLVMPSEPGWRWVEVRISRDRAAEERRVPPARTPGGE